MSDPESPESLHELPQPYDISEAVAQALRIKSTSSCDESSFRPATRPTTRPTKRTTSEIKEREEVAHRDLSQTTEEAYEDLIPELGSSNLLDEVFDNLPLPDMDTDAWSERMDSNREELERFCKFIGGEDEEYTPSSKTRSRQKRALRSPAKPDCTRQLQIALPPTAVSSYAHPVVELVNAQLWREFSSIGTEMVITKNGRRMFPAVLLSVKGLNPNAVYSIYLDIIPVDDRRYKFMQTEWVPVGKADKKFVYKEYNHPDSPISGAHWMEKPVSFKMLKLTNNQSTTHADQVILNSMQMYQPTVRIVCNSDGHPTSHVFRFPETIFIAVTAYQNSKITDLKISYNPYARAFRDSIPSEEGTERKGGHCKQSSSPSPRPPPSPRNPPIRFNGSGGSTTSIESGFESGESGDLLSYGAAPSHTQYSPVEHFYQPTTSYWVDEYSLYHSALIYPPPCLEPTTAFSDPYLRQASRMRFESTESSTSPVKPLPTSRLFPQDVDVEITYNDVFV